MKQKLLLAALVAQTFITANAQQFGSRTVLNSSSDRHSSFAFYDIDDDGDIDILATTSTGTVSSSSNQVCWYKNLGNETFSARTIISSAYEDVNTVRVLDIDEDGKKDLVIGDRELGMSWIKNMGGGFFGTKQNLPFNTYMTTFEVGDMNNDGKEDIIVANLGGDSLYFLRNTGGGTFVYETMFYSPSYNIYSITFGDLDQDQVTDLIVSSGDTQPQRVIQFEYINNAFVQTNIYASPSSNPYVLHSYLYDVDADGKTDVVVRSTDCTVYWIKNFGNNVYSTMTPMQINNCNSFEMQQVGDLDLDGYMDALYTQFNASTISYREGTGVGELGAPMLPISGNTIPGIVGRTKLFDIDEDGDLDVFYSTDNEFGWFANNASALSAPDHAIGKFSVYPNPASQELNIASTTGIDAYAIYDATGKLIDKATLPAAETNYKVNVSAFGQGLYFVEINSGSTKRTQKFVKN